MVDRHSRRQSGNIFFALFGAIALVGILGAGIMTFIKGPLTMSVNLTKNNAAENQMTIAAQVAVMASANAVGGGDCDSDNVIEPIEWRSYTTEPHPTGGGLIPLTLGVNPKDPWGTEFGYCVWNHGTTTTGAGCGANLLAGANSQNYPVVALVSAGPDRTFTTTCRTFAAADVNSDGDVADATDLELVSKAAVSDDDVIYTYTYADAISAAGGLWGLKSNDPGTAAISKNIEVTGNASSTGTGSFSGGVLLPDTSLITCDASTAGVMARSTSGTGIELCDGTSWQQISGSGGGGGPSSTVQLPNQTVNTTCNPANTGLMRYNTTGTSSSTTVTTGSGATVYATPAVVQSANLQYTSAGSGPVSANVTFSTTPTIGNFVIVSASSYSNTLECDVSATLTVSDNKGNSYSRATSASSNQGGSAQVQSSGIWYAPITLTGSSFTVTATSSTCERVALSLMEVSGLAASPLDATGKLDGGSSTNSITISTTGSTTQATELAVSVASDNNDNVFDALAGWTSTWNGVFVSTAYQVLSSVGVVSRTWSTGSNWAKKPAAIATFKAAASGGGGPTTTTETSSTYTQVCDGSSWVNVGRNELNDLYDVITNYTGTASTSSASLYSMYLGDGAGTNATTGAQYNTSLGYQSLYTLASGTNNTAMGYQALKFATTGSENAAFGSRALYTNILGSYNTAMGYGALYANTGSYNTGFGYGALYSGGAKYANTAIGYEAMYYADSSSTASAGNNTAVGYQSLKGGSTAASNTGTDNSAIGYQALTSNTAGIGNTAAGYQALKTTATGGNYNTAIGYQALYSHTGNSHGAVGIGYQAGYSNTQGGTVAVGSGAYYNGVSAIGNTAVGHQSMFYANSSGASPTTNNTAVGAYSMYGTTTASANTGTDNTGLGHNALFGIRNGSQNTAAGSQAMYTMSRGSSNTAAGAYAMYSANRSSYNTAIGYASMRYIYNGTSTASQEAYGNTAVGYQALMMASGSVATNTGNYNTAVGAEALAQTTTGTKSVAVGYQAMAGNTTGTGIGVGYQALGTTSVTRARTGIMFGNSAGRQNRAPTGSIGIGVNSLYVLGNSCSTSVCNGNIGVGHETLFSADANGYSVAIGHQALRGSVGSYNTAVGHVAGQAGTSNTTGTNNTWVGYAAQSNANNYTNGTALGNGAILTGSNRIVLGNTSIAGIYAQVTSITAISDRRHKKDITDTDLGFSFINTLHPVSYRFNNGDETLRYGLIAQEVEKALPDKTKKLVGKKENGLALVNHDDDKEQTYHVTYGELISPLVKAVQELDKTIEEVIATFDAFAADTKTKISALVGGQKELQQKREQQDKEIAELEASIRGLQLSCVAAGGAKHD